MDIRFDCTMCGKCCHDLRLPLSVAEAVRWSERGGRVQILTEAIPWVDGILPDEPHMRHKGERAFPVVSGKLPFRVVATLVAAFEGACPYLREDMRCGGYEERPRVCRIYPAEVHPLVELDPERKACPPDAWGPDRKLLTRDGIVVDPTTASLIEASRRAGLDDVPAKATLCAKLGIDRAALSNEGFVVYTPPGDVLAASTKAALDHSQSGEPSDWMIVSNRSDTIEMIAAAGAAAEAAPTQIDADFEYAGFFPSQ